MGWLYHQKLATTLLMETTIQPFWMYFEMKNYHQSWCFQYIYLYKLRKLSFFTKFPEKTIFLTKKKQDRGRWYQLCLIINLLRPWTETSLQELTHGKHTRIQKKLSYITHAYSCAFLLSLSFCRNTNTVGAFLACLKSWPLSQTMNRILCYCCSQTV